jgi:peptidoglycan/LPS O-acetylase OafA/YrhL
MQKAHIPALTGVRAVAAGIVFIGHMIGPHHDVVPAPLRYGWTGVNIFFALSGYLFQHLYAESLVAGVFSWSAYIKRRLVRIYPVTMLIVLLSALSLLGSVSPLDVGLHLTLLHGWHPYYRMTLNAPMWTLTLEESFYIIAPVLIYYLAKFQSDLRRRLKLSRLGLWPLTSTVVVVLILWALTVAAGRGLAEYYRDIAYFVTGRWDPNVLTYTIFGRLGDFVSGMLAASVMATFRDRLSGRGDILVVVGSGLYLACINAIVVLGGPTQAGNHKLGTIALNGLAFCAAIVIAGLHAGGWASRLLSTRPAILLGEISFALYLIQFMPLGPIRNIGMALQWNLEQAGLNFVLAAFTAYVVMNIAALGVHYLYERPVGRALRKKVLRY